MTQSDGASGQHLNLGRSGEARAAKWYSENGFVLVARNWRCRNGEIDLIVTRDKELVFCEVKTRSSNRFGIPAEAVSFAKQRKLRALAAAFLQSLPQGDPLRNCAIRFDVASVTLNTIDVIEYAF